MKTKALLVFLIILLSACAPAADTVSPEAIISTANTAWNDGDVATLKSLYAEEAQVCFPDWGEECTEGAQAVGTWIEELVALNFVIEPESVDVDADTVTCVAKVWADPSRQMGIAPLVTNDVYTVVDGKITRQVSTLDEESAVKLMEAMAAMEEGG